MINLLSVTVLVVVFTYLAVRGKVFTTGGSGKGPLKGKSRAGYTPLARCHGFMAWFYCAWSYPAGWCGPYVKIYRCGYRICGFETEYFATFDLNSTGSDEDLGIQDLHLIAPVDDYGN